MFFVVFFTFCKVLRILASQPQPDRILSIKFVAKGQMLGLQRCYVGIQGRIIQDIIDNVSKNYLNQTSFVSIGSLEWLYAWNICLNNNIFYL